MRRATISRLDQDGRKRSAAGRSGLTKLCGLQRRGRCRGVRPARRRLCVERARRQRRRVDDPLGARPRRLIKAPVHGVHRGRLGHAVSRSAAPRARRRDERGRLERRRHGGGAAEATTPGTRRRASGTSDPRPAPGEGRRRQRRCEALLIAGGGPRGRGLPRRPDQPPAPAAGSPRREAPRAPRPAARSGTDGSAPTPRCSTPPRARRACVAAHRSSTAGGAGTARPAAAPRWPRRRRLDPRDEGSSDLRERRAGRSSPGDGERLSERPASRRRRPEGSAPATAGRRRRPAWGQGAKRCPPSAPLISSARRPWSQRELDHRVGWFTAPSKRADAPTVKVATHGKKRRAPENARLAAASTSTQALAAKVVAAVAMPKTRVAARSRRVRAEPRGARLERKDPPAAAPAHERTAAGLDAHDARRVRWRPLLCRRWRPLLLRRCESVPRLLPGRHQAALLVARLLLRFFADEHATSVSARLLRPIFPVAPCAAELPQSVVRQTERLAPIRRSEAGRGSGSRRCSCGRSP